MDLSETDADHTSASDRGGGGLVQQCPDVIAVRTHVPPPSRRWWCCDTLFVVALIKPPILGG